MAQATKYTTISFDKDILTMIHKQANLDGISATEFMRNAILEKLEDTLDYQDAVRNLRTSNGETVSRDDVKKQLGLD
ncbi:type II toxin-antitoxin system RelB family antitoxin [Lactobacillus corticis]|uniref:CopG family transcriptional regulator n=1 Tax=Lactobacillus corticis TaxID=2201249 RepID=A0A916QI52_9LACO|nr:DUF6290 family protein [Lactobacillus corticis]GFZ27384.1 hypothetical protein LCB40_12640 [Lactobacillus corticis]